ncbi:hypothetical protein EDB86DRAFT_3010375 [Lactarius hatsudake]|nr:hypothetical protein EDB86DRAFT_3010375 [Lactarius hatsudake]
MIIILQSRALASSPAIVLLLHLCAALVTQARHIPLINLITQPLQSTPFVFSNLQQTYCAPQSMHTSLHHATTPKFY